MTCIVGILDDDGTIYMGGDSAATGDDYGQDLCMDKVFLSDEFIFGYAGSGRFCQLVKFSFDPPPITEPLDSYMCSAWLDALRDCLRSGGHLEKKDNREWVDGKLLIGVRGHLFQFQEDLECAEYRLPYAAVGCAYQLALGSLFSTKGRPRQRIMTALEAAERFCGAVRRPFCVKTLKP